jgi:PAS domain S-box-containing protein/diguanylate cyclase (GGDEF)-like protein
MLRSDYLLAPTSRPMAAGKRLRGLRKDGTEIPLEVGLNPVRVRGELLILAAITDISSRLEAEERFHIAEQMRLVIDGAAQAMIVTDRKGRITLVNSEVERIFGYMRQELLNSAVDMLVPERLRAGYLQLRKDGGATQPAEDKIKSEHWGLHKDGREIPIEIDFSPLTTSRGDFVLASIIDISERKHAEEMRRTNASHAVEIEALTVEKRGVETSLAGSEERVRRQATRLESLWHIVNTPRLSGDDLVLAMLGDAAAAIRPGQSYTGTLGHIEDAEYVVDSAAVSGVGGNAKIARMLHVGKRLPLNETLLARDLAAGRTQSWEDCQTVADLPAPARKTGVRSQITTQFIANDVVYILMLASLEIPDGISFSPEDYEYVEVLGSFFSRHLEAERAQGALRAAEVRTRRHAERLATLWRVANNPRLRGHDLILSMLRQAAAAIRPHQQFHGLLGRIDGDEVVVIGVGAEPGTNDAISRVEIGRRTLLAQTVVPSLSRTQGWDDLADVKTGRADLAFLGWRSAISTQFVSGDRKYWLAFGSVEPTSLPFDSEDFIYIELLASSFADHMQVDQLESSLRNAEARSRHHAERLEALWQIANDRHLNRHERLLAMLRQAAVALRANQRFCGLLGRIEDNYVTLIGVGIAPGDHGRYRPNLDIGSRTPLEKTPIASINRTRSWDDLATAEGAPKSLLLLGWRAAISTQFEAGGSWYSLTFGSLEPTAAAFDAGDFAYLDVLSSSFGNQLQVSQLEGSLHDEEERARHHAERLDALRSLVNDPSLHGDDQLQAMLALGAASIRPDQNYRGILWVSDGASLTAKATASNQPFPKDFPAVGSSIPLEQTICGIVMANGGGTRSWDNFSTSPEQTRLTWMRRTHSLIVTTFHAGAKSWGLTFASGETTHEALGPQDNVYLEVLATFFANSIQQRWQFERIQYQQSHDVLTGLLSRSHFRSRARAAAGQNVGCAIILVNIDDFREINETRGHMIGDAVLVEVGNALKKLAAVDEIVGRIEGDVFGIFVPDPISRDFAHSRAVAFSEVFASPFATGDRDGLNFIARTGTIGLAVAPGDGTAIDAVLSHAGAALLNAKAHGHGTIVCYEAGMEGDALRRATLLNELKEALAEDQFILYFQPHIEIATGNVAGCEALIRWKHPVRGFLLPGDFIPFAEESGIITSIDTWVMQKALAAANELAALRPDFRVYFNLSGRQAGDSSVIRAFTMAARDGVRLSNVGVEITESDAMRDVEATRRVCRALRRLNIRIAIDDFGTGYSSLSSLKRLPIDIVKIDQSFISGVLKDRHDETIAETIISITKHFGLDSLAEGVEHADEVEWLRKRGCRYMQGFAICRPLPFEAFKTWLSEHPHPSGGGK